MMQLHFPAVLTFAAAPAFAQSSATVNQTGGSNTTTIVQR